MVRFIRISKALLLKELAKILVEIKDFKFENWGESNFLRDLPGKWKYSIFLMINRKIAGFSINSLKMDALHIHFLYVFKFFRKSGAATKIINKCVQMARNDNILKITLKCHINNYEAINFYLKNGFIIWSLEKNKYYCLYRKIINN